MEENCRYLMNTNDKKSSPVKVRKKKKWKKQVVGKVIDEYFYRTLERVDDILKIKEKKVLKNTALQ